MRIVHTNMLRGWGGQSNRILTEARGTAARGHEVVLAVPEGSKLQVRATEAGLPCWHGFHFRPPIRLHHFLPDIRLMTRRLREWQPDIIHVHGSQDMWVMAMTKRLWKGRFPIVIRTKHNTWVWRRHLLNRWVYRQCDAYVSISSFVDDQVDQYPGIGHLPRARIPSVPDVSRIYQKHPSIRPELKHWREGMFLWGCTARLRWEKGYDVLLRAFAEVRRTRPETFLVIAGDGSERGALERLAREELRLGPDALEFLGFRTDVPAILQSLDCYVLASREEGLGTSILEALAAGLPVIASDTGGIPDSVRHEKTGLLSPVDDHQALAAAMIRVMDDAALRARLGDGARRIIAEEFVEERLVDRTIAFYQHLLDQRPITGA